MIHNISGKKLLKVFFLKTFTSDITNSIVNVILPILISLYCLYYRADVDKNWWTPIAIMLGVILVFNILSVIVRSNAKKGMETIDLIYKCYNEHCSINKKSATSIYRLNKLIEKYIYQNQPVPKMAFDKIVDFQTVSFAICKSLHNIITEKYDKDVECEVTVFQRFNNDIEMIAYANNTNVMPGTYNTKYDITKKTKNIGFIKIFKDVNAQIVCWCNKEEINDNFKILDSSSERESKICQYIGIPIKTDRNKVELLLQIDVSKPKVFGNRKKNVENFAKTVVYPYAVLLHKSYERDLIFNKYYDMIVETLPVKIGE